MPNWCINTLKVTGPKDDIMKLREKMKGSEVDWPDTLEPENDDELGDLEFDFNQFVPVPEDIREKGFNHGGSDWCVSNWGTKWNSDNHRFYQNDKMLFVGFDTAWAPPIPVIKAMGEMFPNLTFQLDFKEGGMQFMGIYIVERGGVTMDSYVDGDDYTVVSDFDESLKEETEAICDKLLDHYMKARELMLNYLASRAKTLKEAQAPGITVDDKLQKKSQVPNPSDTSSPSL